MEELLCTTEAAKRISAINRESVHQICSGQVILDLATIVKELVENSLDSGATIIEIIFLDYGKTSITVIDNGSGIHEKDFESLGLKHYTSKLKVFSDLEKIETFGFRGEALSSLCALSDINIITKHFTALCAFDLSFDKNGHLLEKKKCARAQGTTVLVKNIFKNLPVREKEFKENAKREFIKMTHILRSYCLVSIGVKLICKNIFGSKSPKIILLTRGSMDVLDNVSAVFNKKTRENLLEVELAVPDKEILDEYYLSTDDPLDFTWKCYVSTCTHALGRSAPDKQFFYINNRPCDLPKVSKLINFIYRIYNNKQYPFVFLNITMKKNCADVNVTPDKRTILLTEEKMLFAAIKSNFKKLWDSQQGVFTKKTLHDIFLESINKNSSLSLEDGPPLKKPCNQSRDRCYDIEDIKTKLLKMSGSTTKSIDIDVNRQDLLVLSSNNVVEHETGKIIPGYKEDFMKKNETFYKADKFSYDSFDDDVEINTKLTVATMTISLSSIKDKLNKVKLKKKLENESISATQFKTCLSSKISEIEKELKDKLISESFEKMEIIGQFNLGFILTKLGNNLFFIDQHASDEKYRFEKLSIETKLKTQKLIAPKLLNLSVSGEYVLIENQNIFENNGFTFKINNDEHVGSKVQLTGMPVSFNWQFSREDIDELIFLIEEGGEDGTNSNIIPRPSRIRQMFASRACRSAVMFGKTLNRSKMRQIVRQMGEMHNPWTCPHGRPTIRHFLTLSTSNF